jgi:hypothetical protein
MTRGSGYLSTDDVICEIKSLDNLKTFVETMIPDVPDQPWPTRPGSRFWRLVSLEMREGQGLTIAENPDDSDHSLQELIAVLEEQERIKAVKSQIREAALLLNQKLCRLPHGSIIIDDDFLMRVATANGMLREQDIDNTKIGNGVSYASALERATENVVGYRRETLSVDKLWAEYQGLLLEFETTNKSQPAGE